jgi:6-phospho-beta-glucosidase
VLTTLGCVPSYYLRYFYAHDEVVAEQRGAATRGQRVAEIEAALLEMYADPALEEKPDLLMQRGGAYYSEAAVGLIASLDGNAPSPHAANVRNAGTLPFLDEDSVIEVTCDVDRDGPRPRPVGPVTPELSGLIAHVSGYEHLAVDAALRGGRERVYRAMLAHPLVGQHTLAENLTDRLLAANASHLAWAR